MNRDAATPRSSSLPIGGAFAFAVVALLLFATYTAPALAQSGKRVALLIGNATYSGSMTRLTNPPNDVAALRPALAQLGFEVAIVSNGDQKAMQRAIRTFGSNAKKAEVAFFYYSGHGMQANGENYLIPVGAQIDKESDLAIEAVQLNGLMQQIEEANPQTAIVVLDACRDNPVASSSRSGSKGLSRIAQTPMNTYIAFAAQPGATATDDGIFARSLAKFMLQPGVSVRGVFDKVAQAVQQHTNNKQRPRRDDGLSTDIVLARTSADAAGNTNRTSTVVAGLEARRTPTNPQQIEDEAWADAKRADTIAAYDAYKAGYPNGRYLASANIAIARLKHAAPSAPAVAARPTLSPVTPPSANPIPTSPGQTFRDCPDCPEMVMIPAGSFTQGSPPSEVSRGNNEGPQRRVAVSAFALSKTTVTFAEWDACVAAGGCRGYRPDDSGWGRGSRPVINVGWGDAQSYVQWLSRKTGKRYSLPSESQWEYAARAGTTTTYHSGDAIGRANANCRDCGSQWDGKQTAPVASFRPNSFGLHDMAGNVRQWTADCSNENYNGAPTDGSAWTAGNCGERMLRGSSWNSVRQIARSAQRMGIRPVVQSDGVGFRLARMLP
jgi:formylglycine-generating enzyme required for sulfatase activity